MCAGDKGILANFGLAITLLISACGGRVSHPVPETTPYDAQLDCAHLQAEKAVNAARARDLAGEQEIDANNNVGLLIQNPLFFNLGFAERAELKAFAAREVVLNKLITQKCAK